MNSKTLALSLSAAAFLISCKQQAQPVKAPDGTTKIQAVHALWHCAMHPQIIRDHPGNCPICGMDLVPFQQEGAATPDTAMQSGTGTSRHAAHDIAIDPTVVQKIGVRTEIVQAGTVGPQLRVDAEGVLDEVAELSVTVRTMGYLESVASLRTGDRVRVGQTLASFYSPDLVAAQGEWLDAKSGGDSVAARAGLQRLRSYGVSESVLASVAASGKVSRTVPVVSPTSGWLSKRLASSGQSTMAGQELFRVVDGAGVLVDARVPQSRLSGLATGSPAEISGLDLATPVKARVRDILPVLGTDRTASVRLQIAGKNTIRVGGLYQVSLHPKSETGLVVPDGAVLHSGTRNVVFVALLCARKLAPTCQFVPPGPLSLINARWTDAKLSETAKPDVHISFWDYFRVGLPITVATVMVGALWLAYTG